MTLIRFGKMSSSVKKAFSRLPPSLIPVHYKLRLKPDLEKFTFQGWAQIQLKVKEETQQVSHVILVTFDVRY